MTRAPEHLLVTGATGGIGAATAAAFARRGCRLTLVARHHDRLADLAAILGALGADAAIHPADLSRPADLAGLVRQVIERRGPIDILINNAAINWFGRFETMPAIEIDRLVDLDLKAPMQLARTVLPIMLARGSGMIVNIGSVFGGVGFAGFAGYSACKFALRGFSEALRRELRGSGVAVLYVAPRYTRTAANAGAIERMAAAVGLRVDEPARVAKRIVAATMARRAETVLGWPERLLVGCNAVFPRLVDVALARTTDGILSVADGEPAAPELRQSQHSH
jgi:short-subunit dehydrogenase